LSGDPTAVNGAVDVIDLSGLSDAERLGKNDSVRCRGEKVLDGPGVNRDLTGAGTKTYPGDGRLAATNGLN
jgi:hypothetical protein